MVCRYNIPSYVWLFVLLSIGEFYSPAASAGTYEDLEDCENVHFYKPTCPKYDETQQCLNKVKVDSDFVAMSKTFMIAELKAKKNASCSDQLVERWTATSDTNVQFAVKTLTFKGTCLRFEYSKCTDKYIDLLGKNHPDVCMEANNTLVCLKRLTDACPLSIVVYNGGVSLELVELSIKDCSEGYHEGSCAPRHVDSCVEFAWEKVPEGHFVPMCHRAQFDAANSCLGKIKSSCTPRQLGYHGLVYNQLKICHIID